MFRKSTSLTQRLKMLLAVCLIPFTVLTIYVLMIVCQVSERYDNIVNNITYANTYNIHFKEEVDYTMYVIVVNSERASELVDIEKPHELIEEAKKTFGGLAENEADRYPRNQLTRIVKSLDTLEKHIGEIERDARISGMYDKNLERLDLNIRIMTEQIEEQIQEYIYYEVTNLEALKKDVRRDVTYTLSICFILLAIILSGALFLSRKISCHLIYGIEQLRMVTRKAGHGDFTVRAHLEEDDEELAELGNGFNQMVERIGNLVENIRVEQLNLRATEQKLLQAQINPHFLYNTLDAIVWLAEANQNEQVIMMVTALSDFFRMTLSNGRDYITVQEEESHIRSYLKIQQFRYQDILEYEIDIPKEMYRYHILKLTLQPLVENALYHGLKNKRGMGHIKVTGQMDGGHLVFLVKDDGIGMTEERLAQVQKMMNREEEKGSEASFGFGLFNVEERMKLNYGAEYGIRISSRYQEGTEVRVEVPAIENEQKSKEN